MKQRKYSIIALIFFIPGLLYYSVFTCLLFLVRFRIIYSKMMLFGIPSANYYIFISVYLSLMISLVLLIQTIRKRKTSLLVLAPLFLIATMAGIYFTNTDSAEFIVVRYLLNTTLNIIIPDAVVKFIPLVFALIFEIVALLNKRRIPSLPLVSEANDTF